MMPNFLIIGARKSGTTTLHYVLDQHPEIFMSPTKEPAFFWAHGEEVELQGPMALLLKHRVIHDLDHYQQLFDGVTTEKAVGESTSRYLTDSRSPSLIHQFIPRAKLIAILRHPADCAFSKYTQYLRDGVETCTDFGEVLTQERQGLRDYWTFGHYLREGFYHAALTRYMEFFDPEQIHVSLFEDFVEAPMGLTRNIFRFLEVDENYLPDLSQRHNVSGVIRNPAKRFFWTRSNSLRAAVRPLVSLRMRHLFSEWVFRDLEKPQFPPALRAELTEHFRGDIERLQDLLGRDLSHWLE